MRIAPGAPVAVVSILLASVAPARDAEDRAPSRAPPPVERRAPAPHALANGTPLFLGLEFATSAALTLTLVAVADDAKQCRWCIPTSLDASVRDAVRTHDSRGPALASHFVSLGAAPLAAFGAVIIPALGSKHPSYALADSVVILDSVILVTGFADLTKKASARERPAFHHGRQSETEFSGSAAERNRSFFSGDTAWAFTFGASGATLAYQRGYWTAPYAVAAGAGFGVATGALRIMADAHWFTDVLAGAAIGTATGAALPLLVHRRRASAPLDLSVAPVVTREVGAIVASGSF